MREDTSLFVATSYLGFTFRGDIAGSDTAAMYKCLKPSHTVLHDCTIRISANSGRGRFSPHPDRHLEFFLVMTAALVE